MANNFSAASLTGTTAILNAQIADILKRTAELSSITSSISSLVRAGSGSLAGQWSQISETYSAIGTSIDSSVNELITEMTNYITQTLENEANSSSLLQNSNDQLNDLKAEISGL
jgi:SMC interacting uncharacterized protein involved in chromosome segregation